MDKVEIDSDDNKITISYNEYSETRKGNSFDYIDVVEMLIPML